MTIKIKLCMRCEKLYETVSRNAKYCVSCRKIYHQKYIKSNRQDKPSKSFYIQQLQKYNNKHKEFDTEHMGEIIDYFNRHKKRPSRYDIKIHTPARRKRIVFNKY